MTTPNTDTDAKFKNPESITAAIDAIARIKAKVTACARNNYLAKQKAAQTAPTPAPTPAHVAAQQEQPANAVSEPVEPTVDKTETGDEVETTEEV